jgi:hypothetical protein
VKSSLLIPFNQNESFPEKFQLPSGLFDDTKAQFKFIRVNEEHFVKSKVFVVDEESDKLREYNFEDSNIVIFF